MENKVIPLKPEQTHRVELDRVYLADSIADICNSKSLSNQTAPGIKLFYVEHEGVRFEYKHMKGIIGPSWVRVMFFKNK